MGFQEVFVGDECFKFPNPLKRDREWFREFVVLNQNKSNAFDEDYEESINEMISNGTDAYLMIINIGYLFNGMGDFNLNNSKDFFELWEKNEAKIKRRIEIINKCLDVYDIIYPFTFRKPILKRNDLRLVYKLMFKIIHGSCYTIMDDYEVDLDMEIGCPGWFELKKVLLRFFSKVNFDREFDRLEEEVDGTGYIRGCY